MYLLRTRVIMTTLTLVLFIIASNVPEPASSVWGLCLGLPALGITMLVWLPRPLQTQPDKKDEVPMTTKKVLEPVGTITVPGASIFTVAEKFFVGCSEGVLIASMSENFCSLLDKVERDVPAAVLRGFDLPKKLFDEEIINHLGPNYRVRLSHVWEAVKQQPLGEDKGVLSTKRGNLFYIEDTQLVVFARCTVRGWDFRATSVGHNVPWYPGPHVFSL